MKSLELTAPQRAMMRNIARVVDEYDGIAPHHAGDWIVIRSLLKLGLVRFVSFGECGDDCERAGDCPHPVQIYTLTDAGHDAIDRVGVDTFRASLEGEE